MQFNRKPIMIHGRYYPSIQAAARELHTNYSAVFFAVAGKAPPHKRNTKPGYRWATPEEIDQNE